MRKIILCFMFLLGMVIFAEKLTTDGKDNLDKLKGKWVNGQFDFINSKNKWYLETYCGDCSDNGMDRKGFEKYKNGVFIIKNFYQMPNKKDKNFYFAWDTKYKVMVELDKDLNIISKYPRKINGPAG